MKKIIILLLVLSRSGFAQDCLREVGGGACIVMENDKYGIKKKGKYIVPTYFDQIADHSGRFFSVEQNGKWGIFNIKGQIVLPVAFEKVTAVNADAGLITATGNGYNNLVITENIVLPKFAQKANPFLMISETEVSLAEYLLFMTDIKNNPPKDFTYQMAFPDTSRMAPNTKRVFTRFFATMGDCFSKQEVLDSKLELPLVVPCSISNDKILNDYLALPMNGITHKQAQRYCIWLSEKLNGYHTDGEAYEMVVRLPRPVEWEEIAVGGLDESMKKRLCIDSLNAKSCILFNYKYNKEVCTAVEEQERKYGVGIVPVRSYNADFHGAFNTFGNVAEMTTEEGMAMGGSYQDYAAQCRTNRIQKYNGPSPWVGFRWVIEYRMKK